jgi:hypothetical protein
MKRRSITRTPTHIRRSRRDLVGARRPRAGFARRGSLLVAVRGQFRLLVSPP